MFSIFFIFIFALMEILSLVAMIHLYKYKREHKLFMPSIFSFYFLILFSIFWIFILLTNITEPSNSKVAIFTVLLEEYGWIIIFLFALIFAWVAGYMHSLKKKIA